jgi:hypothetical protein
MKLDHVRVRDCACPETPHEGHFVFVTSTLSLEGGVEAEAALIAAITTAGKGPVDTKALEVLWRDIFVRHGVVGWDLCDEDGEPIPFSLEALREDFSIARPVLLHIENKDWGELADPKAVRLAVAAEFGWAAISSQPMDWEDYSLARKYLVEHRIGTRIREQKAIEDAQARANRKASR